MTPIRAVDVLRAEAAFDPLDDDAADAFVAALLAQTPDGEGLYLAPDATLARAVYKHTISASHPEIYEGDPDDLGVCYRIVPLEAAEAPVFRTSHLDTRHG